ncbi:major facilitator superfamily domain-containing protein [Syncephalastrum racemosum]|uniref:Major facilitator superfamily domain-containing protein n=1 Tax=Syncephalastrum racemosum TaxID=13706 RepID=A0A1X2HIM5_SYNRA|nr:major facilitator superfamily domain-containing protein [Syncephalastrum racemosum]
MQEDNHHQRQALLSEDDTFDYGATDNASSETMDAMSVQVHSNQENDQDEDDQKHPYAFLEEHISLALITFCSNLSSWIFTSYLLSSSAVQPLYAKLSDVFGRKSTLVCVISFFFVGSWLCALARSMLQLALARAIAGLGGGGLMCMASVVIHDLVPIRKRGQYQSYVNMGMTVGTAIGAPLGGLLATWFGWRSCFYINLPPCALVLYVYTQRLPNYNKLVKQNLPRRKIDVLGACLLCIANTSFVTGTSLGGNTREWSDPLIIGMLTSAAIFFSSFVIYELNWAADPILSPRMIKNRNVLGACASNFWLWGSMMALSYLIPQFFMGVRGYNASSTGLWVFPRTVVNAFGCWFVGRHIRVTGRYKHYMLSVTFITMLAVLGIATLWVPYSDRTPFALLCMMVEGFGVGTVIVGSMVALVADVAHEDVGSATSMIFLFRSTGFVCGSTISGAIVQVSLKSLLMERIQGPEAKQGNV